MFGKILFKSKSNRQLRSIVGMLITMLIPFMSFSQMSIVPDEGGGATVEEKMLAKVKKAATDEVTTKMDAFKTEFKTIALDAFQGKMTEEKLMERLTGLEEKSKEFESTDLKKLKTDLDAISEKIKSQAAVLKAMKEDGSKAEDEKKGIGTIFRETLEKNEQIEEYVIDPATELKGMRFKSVEQKQPMRMKAAIDMTTALSLTPGSTPGVSIGYLTDYMMQDVLIALSKDVHAISILPLNPVAGKYMGVLVEYTYVDGVGTKAEAGTAAQSSLKFKTLEYKVFNLATRFRVSKENLMDIANLEAKLNRIAPDRILGSLDDKIFSSGGDNSSDIKGMFAAAGTTYTAFVASTYSGTVQDANILDLIKLMKLQAEIADEDVNVVFLHPTRINEIEMLKDADKNYLQARGIVFDKNGNLVKISGLLVAKNKKVATTECVVMWNEAAEIGVRDDISFEIGTDGSDFSQGMRTILFEFRVAFGVGKPGAIIYTSDVAGDISTIIEVSS